MGQLAKELREADFQDIIFDLVQIEHFRELDDKHDFDPNWKDFRETIKLLNKHCDGLLKDYESRWGFKPPKQLLRRLWKS